MAEKNWAAILKGEDRIIANSDRRFRYHCYSLESMSEELTYKERSIYMVGWKVPGRAAQGTVPLTETYCEYGANHLSAVCGGFSSHPADQP